MLNLRMGKSSTAKHTLGNRNIVSTKESLITSAASSLGTTLKRATNGLAIGRIEIVETDRARHF